MTTFLIIMETLAGLEVLNIILFLMGIYTTEAMILFNAVLLAIVSIVCVVEISIFSHRFRTVLRTLGAINQVSGDTITNATCTTHGQGSPLMLGLSCVRHSLLFSPLTGQHG